MIGRGKKNYVKVRIIFWDKVAYFILDQRVQTKKIYYDIFFVLYFDMGKMPGECQRSLFEGTLAKNCCHDSFRDHVEYD